MASTHQHNISSARLYQHTRNESETWNRWEDEKARFGFSNKYIDSIMNMIGLEQVKAQVLRIKDKIETCKIQGTDLSEERLGLMLLGNPGTRKTTIARLYAKILTSLQVISGTGYIETTGSRLAYGGINKLQEHLADLDQTQGGVLFIDEAYQLAENHTSGGKMVLDYLLAEMEDLIGKVVFVFAGYRENMKKFYQHNPGFAGRIQYTFHFEDYTDKELMMILQTRMHRFFRGDMGIADGPDGLHMRIAIRRLGRGRGQEGFGNARAVENLFSNMRAEQADRYRRELRDGLKPDPRLFTQEDLIGPDPSVAILKSAAWTELQAMTGLDAVKASVRVMIDRIKTNYLRELREQELIVVSLNRLFLGGPGTGKTTVAKLYGRILWDLRLLSDGEVILNNPADFIGSHLGESEKNTSSILDNAAGKVLVIDEAYMLASKKGGGDMYGRAVIDTIVAKVQSVPGEDRCVLLLGYEDEMRGLFDTNPGFARRFPLDDAFRFEDFTDAQLQIILQSKLATQGLGASEAAISTAMVILSRARNGLNFGNAGEVENLLSKAKHNHSHRQAQLAADQQSIDYIFEPEDFDPDHNRTAGAATNLKEFFKDVIESEDMMEKLNDYILVVNGMRARGLDPRGQIPMNFIFKGPPGTGKTTTARKFGQVFFDLGFLASTEVVECSSTDFIGEYTGQTGPKAEKQLEKGLGKVLFIDEAHSLGHGSFGVEAVNMLVDCMTKPKFAGKMVIILAGYDQPMNDLLRVNQGLSGRFAEEFIFSPISPEKCLEILEAKLNKQQIKMTLPSLRNSVLYQQLLYLMMALSKLRDWGSARDVETLAKNMNMAVIRANSSAKDESGKEIVSHQIAFQCMQRMLTSRQARNDTSPLPPPHRSSPGGYGPPSIPPVQMFESPATRPNFATRTSSAAVRLARTKTRTSTAIAARDNDLLQTIPRQEESEDFPMPDIEEESASASEAISNQPEAPQPLASPRKSMGAAPSEETQEGKEDLPMPDIQVGEELGTASEVTSEQPEESRPLRSHRKSTDFLSPKATQEEISRQSSPQPPQQNHPSTPTDTAFKSLNQQPSIFSGFSLRFAQLFGYDEASVEKAAVQAIIREDATTIAHRVEQERKPARKLKLKEHAPTAISKVDAGKPAPAKEEAETRVKGAMASVNDLYPHPVTIANVMGMSREHRNRFAADAPIQAMQKKAIEDQKQAEAKKKADAEKKIEEEKRAELKRKADLEIQQRKLARDKAELEKQVERERKHAAEVQRQRDRRLAEQVERDRLEAQRVQQEAERERTMSPCPTGYSWKLNSNGNGYRYVCQGSGSHFRN